MVPIQETHKHISLILKFVIRYFSPWRLKSLMIIQNNHWLGIGLKLFKYMTQCIFFTTNTLFKPQGSHNSRFKTHKILHIILFTLRYHIGQLEYISPMTNYIYVTSISQHNIIQFTIYHIISDIYLM